MLAFITMPNIRSAAKRVRADRKRQSRNLDFKSELKTVLKKIRALIQKGSAEAKEYYVFVNKRLDQAVSKKLLHKRTASRTKSRLARQLHKLTRPH